MSARRWSSIAVLGVIMLAACGGGAPPNAKSPGSESAPANHDSDGTMDYAPQSPQTGGAAPKNMEASRGQARSELDRAERELAGAAGDCAAACRALASMERAAGHLCDLTSQADSSCEDARSKVRTARDRVRSTCGSCPGGPTLERSAPIASP